MHPVLSSIRTGAASDEVVHLGRRVGMTAKTVRAYADQRLAAVGSDLSAWIITAILSREPHPSQRDLAERMGVEGPTMVRHLDRLEREGVVARTRDGNDRRVVRVSLTANGRSLRRRLGKVADATNVTLTGIFSPDELSRFEEYLDRLAGHAAAQLDLDSASVRP